MWLAAEAGQGESHDTCVPETQARQVSASGSQPVLVWHLPGIWQPAGACLALARHLTASWHLSGTRLTRARRGSG